MEVAAREPRANAAFLRLPRSGNHHDLGLFGVGPAAAPKRRGGIGLYHLAWQVDTIDELEQARDGAGRRRRLHRRVQPRRHQERLRRRPRRQRVRDHVDAAPRGLGRVRERRPDRPPRPRRRGAPLDAASRTGRTRSSPARSEDAGQRAAFAVTRSSPTARQRRPGRAAGRAAARPRLARAGDPRASPTTCPTGRPTPPCARPIAEGGGYAWFANRGIGRPVAESLRATMDWFRGWLDDVAPAGRPVVAGRLQRRRGVRRRAGARRPGPVRRRRDPLRHAAVRRRRPGHARPPGRHCPVFVAQGEHDTVIPRELLDRTWRYLLGDVRRPGRRPPRPGRPRHHAPDTSRRSRGWLHERWPSSSTARRPLPGPDDVACAARRRAARTGPGTDRR